MRFVSILVFVELALGLRHFLRARRASSIVSILVFVELALGQHDLEDAVAYLWKVSILVFVELALGPFPSIVRTLIWWSFNPCFRGTRPRTAEMRATIGPYMYAFQSLFSWNSPSDIQIPGK